TTDAGSGGEGGRFPAGVRALSFATLLSLARRICDVVVAAGSVEGQQRRNPILNGATTSQSAREAVEAANGRPRYSAAVNDRIYILELHGMEQSAVDLDDPTHLVFDYMRRIG